MTSVNNSPVSSTQQPGLSESCPVEPWVQSPPCPPRRQHRVLPSARQGKWCPGKASWAWTQAPCPPASGTPQGCPGCLKLPGPRPGASAPAPPAGLRVLGLISPKDRIVIWPSVPQLCPSQPASLLPIRTEREGREGTWGSWARPFLWSDGNISLRTGLSGPSLIPSQPQERWLL